MPVPNTYFDFFDQPETDFAQFIEGVKALVSENGALFIESTRWDRIPDDGWMDYSHVNSPKERRCLVHGWDGRLVGRPLRAESPALHHSDRC
jgi:hypothetical protein